MGHSASLNGGLSGQQAAEQFADLALGVFGAVHPTEQQRQALADSLIAHAVEWINDEFDVGLTK